MGSLSSKSKEQIENERRAREELVRRALEAERLSRVRLENLEQQRIKREQQLREWQEKQRREQIERQLRDRLLLEQEELRNNQFIDSLKQHKVARNYSMINSLRNSFKLDSLQSFPNTPYTEIDLPSYCSEYLKIQRIFKKSNKPFFTISKIVKVDNTFLELHYLIELEKFRETEQEEPEQTIMFHGTKCEFIDNICSLNFTRSMVKAHKFGWGVSFATNSFYATHYHHDNMRKREKVMILAQVFYDDVEIGNEYMVVPDACYTSRNENGSVYVKYDDASFYPAYIVHYEGLHPKKPNQTNKTAYKVWY